MPKKSRRKATRIKEKVINPPDATPLILKMFLFLLKSHCTLEGVSLPVTTDE